jgi:transposase
MMSTIAKYPALTPIPVPLSEPEFNEFIFPHLAMPPRGPTCKIGDHRLFTRIFWVLYTGMPWKCLPLLKDAHGKPELHDTNVYRAFAKWADDGSRPQAFIASVAHLSDEKKLDLRVRHGDGTNTVAKKGGMAAGILATTIRTARRSSLSPTPMVMSCRHSRWLPSMRRTGSGAQRG